VAAFVSAMGSAGTIAAGDRLKQMFGTRIVGLEPVQCPTLFNVGFGAHAIEGIGDKHVTWIHNVLNMDALCCIDDQDCLEGLQVLNEGWEVLEAEGVKGARSLAELFGISGVCNVLGAIKAARHFGLGPGDLVLTVATDSFDRYPSVMRRLTEQKGPQTRDLALRRLERIFRGARCDHILDGTREVRLRWHHQKYFTWVEQQGKSVEELVAQGSPELWLTEQQKVAGLDRKIRELRT
jgi:hypothetical protein